MLSIIKWTQHKGVRQKIMESIFFTYKAAIDYIESIPKFTEKHPLEHTRQFLDELGVSKQMKVIHVAGTNGKGSVSAMMSNILVTEGKKTGLFISPHLVRHNERIKINNTDISDENFLEVFLNVKNKVDELKNQGITHPSYFEFLFLMGMCVFTKEQVEYVVLETGLGGRLDATNSIENKLMTIITQIGLEHTEYLGNTVEEIAGEKAGIMRENTPVIFQATDDRVSGVIEEQARQLHAEAFPVSKDDYKITIKTNKSIDFCINSGYYLKRNFSVPFISEYQVMNASVVIEAAAHLDFIPAYDKIRQAIADVKWEGRMEIVAPGIILDGAHNGSGIDEFIKTFNDVECRGKKNILFSVVQDKDYDYMIFVISNTEVSKVYITQLDTSRGLDVEQIKNDFEQNNCKADIIVIEDARQAYDEAVAEKREEDMLFCVGSLYLVGELKEHIGNKMEE